MATQICPNRKEDNFAWKIEKSLHKPLNITIQKLYFPQFFLFITFLNSHLFFWLCYFIETCNFFKILN